MKIFILLSLSVTLTLVSFQKLKRFISTGLIVYPSSSVEWRELLIHISNQITRFANFIWRANYDAFVSFRDVQIFLNLQLATERWAEILSFRALINIYGNDTGSNFVWLRKF